MSKELESLNYLTDAASRYARAPLQYSDMYKTIEEALKRNEPMKPKVAWKNEEDKKYRRISLFEL